MIKYLLIITLVLTFSNAAEARHRTVSYAVSSECNVTMPCEGVAASSRGVKVVKAMGGFGTAIPRYQPSHALLKHTQIKKEVSSILPERHLYRVVQISGTQMLPHPNGCPSRLFCGCGAAVEVFGTPRRDLWLAANWLKFPRANPSSGTAMVRSHHVAVLKQHIGGSIWLVADYNSGGHQSRLHARDISGYVIVDPRG